MQRNLIYTWLLVLSTVTLLQSRDYYWVGGSGNWSDLAHWATSSGGSTKHAVVPTADDNVIFDAASFSGPNQMVTVNKENIFCRNMDWSAVTNSPGFKGAPGAMANIYGELTFSANMLVSFKGEVRFATDMPQAFVRSAGHTLGNSIYFDGSGGWVFFGALKADSLIQLTNGTINTNSQEVQSQYFYVEPQNQLTLQLGSSYLKFTGSPFARFNAADIRQTVRFVPNSNFSLIPGSSTFELTAPDAEFFVDKLPIGLNDLIFSSTTGKVHLNINGFNECFFNTLDIRTNAFLTWGFSIQHLILWPGKSYEFLSGAIYNINNVTALGNCLAPIVISANSNQNHTNFISTGGDIIVEFANIKNIHTNGTGAFIANNSSDLGNNTGWNFNTRKTGNLYWVGGTGKWNDPVHWSLISGGPGGACLPTSGDNVFFDQNSFSGNGQIVSINVDNAFCKNMDWSGAKGVPLLTGPTSSLLHITGSLRLIPEMKLLFQGDFLFESKDLGNNIITGGQVFLNQVLFNGPGGEWILHDEFRVDYDIQLVLGNLNTNDQAVHCRKFLSNFTGTRSLHLGSSTIHLTPNQSDPLWEVNGNGLNFSSGSSTLLFQTGTGALRNFGSNDLHYHKIVFSRDFSTLTDFEDLNKNFVTSIDTLEFLEGGRFNDDYTIGELILRPGYAYELVNGIELTLDHLSAKGHCNGFINIRSLFVNNEAYLTSTIDQSDLEYLSLKDIHITGSSKFIAQNSIDLGNNDGWTINPSTGRTLYWVNGTGLWEDALHWSLTSGGVGGACIPSSIDNVIFDERSFTGAGQIVTGSSNAIVYCRDMTWKNVTGNPRFLMDQLYCNGSLTLYPQMVWQVGNTYLTGSDQHTIASNGQNLRTLFLYANGTYSLGADLRATTLYLRSGTFLTKDYGISTGFLQMTPWDNKLTIDLGASHLVITNPKVGSNYPFNVNGPVADLTLLPGTSTIEFNHLEGGGMTVIPSIRFHNVLFSSNSGKSFLRNTGASKGEQAFFNNVQFNNDGQIEGFNSFDTLVFTRGRAYTLEANTSQLIGSYLQIIGNNCNPIKLGSSLSGIRSTIEKSSGIVSVDFIQMQDQAAAGGAVFYAGSQSVNIGNSNTGWIFSDRPDVGKVGFLGEDQVICNKRAVILNANNFRDGETYNWSNGTTNPILVVNKPGTYWAKVTFSNNCELVDTVNVFSDEDFAIDLGNDTSLCTGQSLLLDAYLKAAGIQHVWQDGSWDSKFTVTTPGLYHVEIQLKNCSHHDSILVDYGLPPDLELGPDRQLCRGENVQLNATVEDGTLYRWSDGVTGPIRGVSDEGLYTVAVSTPACTATDSVRIRFLESESVSLGPDTSLCEGEQLWLGFAFNITGAQYLWQDGSTQPRYQVSSPGKYFVVVSQGNCTSTDTILITFVDVPELDLGPELHACMGESIDLDATVPANATYQWADGPSGPHRTISEPGIYKVVVNVSECIQEDSVYVQFFDLPASFQEDSIALCEGQSVEVDLTGYAESYFWQDGKIDPLYIVNRPGEYTVELSNGSCMVRDTFYAYLQPLPSLELPKNITACEGEKVMLEAIVKDVAALDQFYWNGGVSELSLEVQENGPYVFSASQNGCMVQDTVWVEFLPPPSVDLGPDRLLCDEQNTLLQATTSQGTITWQDGSKEGQFLATGPGLFWARVDNGICTTIDSVLLESAYCGKFQMFIPNVFSPNGDGVNDAFEVSFHSDQKISSYQLLIVDRWGNLLYQSNDPATLWDGSSKGQLLPSGVYIYALSFDYQDEKLGILHKYYKGDVSLLR